MDKCYSLTYKGKTYTSKDGFELLSQDEFDSIKKLWYTLPSWSEIESEILKLKYGGTCISKITKYYFRNLMDDTVKYFDKWCINDVFNYLPLLSVIIDKIKRNETFFNIEKMTLDKCVDKWFSLGSKGIVGKVAQFPISICDYILNTYNVNNVWYDYSCGWGSRLTCALKNGVNYYGTDPNYKLTEVLNTYQKDFKSVYDTYNEVHIYTMGSEFFIPELENKVGLCFSSPPYFNLEKYACGKQSYVEGITSYDAWRDDYLEPTIQNCYKYLIDDGYFIINVKNYKKFPIEEDSVRLAEKNGFTYIKTEDLYLNKNFSRPTGKSDERITITEPMFVFKKGNPKIKSKVDLW